MIRTVIFDFDGTLANTIPLVVHCFQEVFRTYAGKEFSAEEIIARFGPTEEGMLEREIAPDAFAAARADYYRLYQEHHHRFVELNPNVASLIDTLQEDGHRLGIFTGKGRATMEMSRRFLPFCQAMEVIVTGDDVVQPKPHPEGLLRCLDMLGAAPQDAVFVGDSNGDVAAGRSAGVTTIGVTWMPVTQSHHFDPAPAHISHHPSEFLDLIRQIG